MGINTPLVGSLQGPMHPWYTSARNHCKADTLLVRPPQGWIHLWRGPYRDGNRCGRIPHREGYTAGRTPEGWMRLWHDPYTDGYTCGRAPPGMGAALVVPFKDGYTSGGIPIGIDTPLVGSLEGWIHVWWDPCRDGHALYDLYRDGCTSGRIPYKSGYTSGTFPKAMDAPLVRSL